MARRYGLRDLPARLRTPLGRWRLRTSAVYHAWPLLAGPAALYRRTLAGTTRVVAVTGSFGKTTTARAIEAALGGHPRLGGHPNARGYIALAVFRVRPGQRHAVIEIGIAGPGEMADRARVVRPDVAVVTAIGSEHHSSFGTLERTRDEKAHLVRVLPASGTAVLNGDDDNVRWMATQTRARVLTFGFNEANDVRAGAPVLDWPHGMQFRISARHGTHDVRVRLLGTPMVYCILAAVTVALAEGLSLDRVIPALERLAPTPGRLEPVPLANGAMLLRDDFKSPQETIDAALHLLGQIPAARRIVVLGDVSEPVGSPRPLYRRIGRDVARVASRAIFLTGSNYSAYAAGATEGGLRKAALVNAKGSVSRAVRALQDDLGPGDVVLIKGRGPQHLGRIALALMGREIRCDLKSCAAPLACDRCPMLERGWEGLRVVT